MLEVASITHQLRLSLLIVFSLEIRQEQMVAQLVISLPPVRLLIVRFLTIHPQLQLLPPSILLQSL